MAATSMKLAGKVSVPEARADGELRSNSQEERFAFFLGSSSGWRMTSSERA